MSKASYSKAYSLELLCVGLVAQWQPGELRWLKHFQVHTQLAIVVALERRICSSWIFNGQLLHRCWMLFLLSYPSIEFSRSARVLYNGDRRVVRDELSCDKLSAASCPRRIVLRRIVREPCCIYIYIYIGRLRLQLLQGWTREEAWRWRKAVMESKLVESACSGSKILSNVMATVISFSWKRKWPETERKR